MINNFVITFNFTSGKYDVIGKDEFGEGAVFSSFQLHSDALAERSYLKDKAAMEIL